MTKKGLFGLFLLKMLSDCFGRIRRRMGGYIRVHFWCCMLSSVCGVRCVSADDRQYPRQKSSQGVIHVQPIGNLNYDNPKRSAPDTQYSPP